MTDIQVEFSKELKRLGIKPKKSLLLALSGGLDSVVLFHLLKRAKVRFSAAHVNYGLRNQDSDMDEAFCRELCKKNGIPFFLYDAKAEMVNPTQRISVQESARNIRYSFFKMLQISENIDYVFTAHHKNDSVETFFINIMRGSGIQGLKGIPEKNGIIIRPLLHFSRQNLKDYAEKNGLEHREDRSNAKDSYLRNRIRHHVFPALEIADNAALQRIEETMYRLASESDLLDILLKEKFSDRIDTTSKSAFLQFPLELRPTVIFKRFQHIGINFSQATDISNALEGLSGKQFHTLTHRILLDREWIYTSAIDDDNNETVLIENKDLILPGYQISIIPISECVINKDASSAYIDVDTIQFPLVWRKIQIGDSMVPLGMKGRKKISDILIDNKINQIEKEKVHVLCSGNEIVWLQNFRISDSSKITGRTYRVLCIIPEKL